MNNKPKNCLIKIVFIGDTFTGKTSVFNNYLEDKTDFDTSFISTIGVDFKVKHIIKDNYDIKVQCWDTAGQERFKSVITSFYRNSDIIFLFFDVTVRKTFENLNFWLDEIEHHSKKENKIVLVGNKTDLINIRQVSIEEYKDYANKHNMEYYETSCKNFDKTIIDNVIFSVFETKKETHAKIVKTFTHTTNVDPYFSNYKGSFSFC